MASISTINVGDLQTNGLLNASILAEAKVRMLLADSTTLRNTAAIQQIGNVAGRGSKVLNVRYAGLGSNLSMDAASSEVSAESVSSVDVSNATVTIARRYLGLDESQLAQIAGAGWGFDPMVLAGTMVDSFEKGFMGLLGTAIQSFGTDVGNASGTASVDDAYDVIETMESEGASGSAIFTMLHPTQIGEVRSEIRSEVGPGGFRTDAQEMLAYKGAGYVGSYLGLHFFSTANVVDATSKYHGAAWVPGAIGYGIGSTERVITNSGVLRPAGIPVVIELEPVPGSGKVTIHSNAYDGLGIIEDARGVGWVTSSV